MIASITTVSVKQGRQLFSRHHLLVKSRRRRCNGTFTTRKESR